MSKQADNQADKQVKHLALNIDLGVAALLDMAARRGLHAARHEAEQAWRAVTVAHEAERLAAAWQWLFAGHSAATCAIELVSNAQLPAWVMGKGCVGILVKTASGDEPPCIEWVVGSPAGDADASQRALVPVPPLRQEQESFAPPKRRGPASAAIRTAMWAHAGLFARAGVATVFINAIAVVSSLFAMLVYDRVVPNFAVATLWFLAAGVALAYVLEALFKYVRLKITEGSTRQLDEALSQHFFERLLGLKLDRRPTHVGTLVAEVRDYEAVKAFFTSSTLFALGDLPFIFVFIGLIYLIGGPVALVPAAFVLISLLIGVLAYKPIAERQRLHNDAIVRRQGLLFEGVAGAETVKAQGGEAQFGDQWQQATRDTVARQYALAMVMGVARFATQFCQQLGYAGILIVGVYAIAAGQLTLGGLIACMILGGRALATIANIANLLLQWHHARYALDVLNQLYASPNDERAGRQANTRSLPLDLTVESLAYGYGVTPLPQLVVPGLKITVGERIAVLGGNGGGKSTLLKLLAGIATPTAGRVRIAGLDYEECRPSWLRETIGYLPQEVQLFAGTLLDNLTLGLSRPPEAEIVAALEKTGLIEAVKAHPQGLQLPIAEGGAGLSGGQRQLLGITRLVLRDPKIWLLDEATASLDSVAEQRLIELIEALPDDRTVIFTTHRQRWLELAQRVLIVEGGTIKVDQPRDKIRMAARGASPATASAPAQAPINIVTSARAGHGNE